MEDGSLAIVNSEAIPKPPADQSQDKKQVTEVENEDKALAIESQEQIDQRELLKEKEREARQLVRKLNQDKR